MKERRQNLTERCCSKGTISSLSTLSSILCSSETSLHDPMLQSMFLIDASFARIDGHCAPRKHSH